MPQMANSVSKSLLAAGMLVGWLGAGGAGFRAYAVEAIGVVPDFAPDRSTAWIPDAPPVTIFCRRSAGQGR